MKKYTESHEWIEYSDDKAKVGVSNYAQKELGDIVFVELPTVGTSIQAGEEIAVLESTKAAADVYSPVTGTITAINDKLVDNPELINSSAESEGWIVEIALSNPIECDSLTDAQSYVEQFTH